MTSPAPVSAKPMWRVPAVTAAREATTASVPPTHWAAQVSSPTLTSSTEEHKLDFPATLFFFFFIKSNVRVLLNGKKCIAASLGENWAQYHLVR